LTLFSASAQESGPLKSLGGAGFDVPYKSNWWPRSIVSRSKDDFDPEVAYSCSVTAYFSRKRLPIAGVSRTPSPNWAKAFPSPRPGALAWV